MNLFFRSCIGLACGALLTGAVWVSNAADTPASYLFEAPKAGSIHNLYYSIAEQQNQEKEDTAITNLTQTLRSYGPSNSNYITEDLVRRIIAEGRPSDLAVILAEMRRKAEFSGTGSANQDAMDMNNPDQGQVFESIRQTEMELKQQASANNALALEPERSTPVLTNQQSWHALIASGDVLSLFTIDDLTEMTTLFNYLYLQEQELAALHVELSAENTYSTIFENGTLSDSFYDLVDDLNTLDRIWYGEQAEDFSAPWQTPKGLPESYQDPRQQSTTSAAAPGTIRIDGTAGNVYVPQTNKALTGLNETITSRGIPVSPNPFYDAVLENRSFMPLFAEHNGTTAAPETHERFCLLDNIFCLTIDINVLSYPLLGSSDFSIMQQLTELRAELGDMSQKNLTIKKAGKNVFEIGLTPGADLSKLLDMNVIVASKPTSFPAQETSVEDRAKTLQERITNDLEDCLDTSRSTANNLQGASNTSITADKAIESQEAALARCQSVLDAQGLIEHQELKNEGHERSFTQLRVMQQTLRTVLNELSEIHAQTVQIESKPRK